MKSLGRRATMVALGVVIVLVTADLRSFWYAIQDAVYVPYRSFNEWHDRLPPPTRAIRKRDLERYPRRGFGIELEYARGFRVDTFLGKATRNMAEWPDTTFDLELSAAQLDTLYDQVIRMRLFEYRGHTPPGYSYIRGQEWGRLVVCAGDARKELEWTRTLPPEPQSDDWKRFSDLQWTIARMVRMHPAYLALPEAGGIID